MFNSRVNCIISSIFDTEIEFSLVKKTKITNPIRRTPIQITINNICLQSMLYFRMCLQSMFVFTFVADHF